MKSSCRVVILTCLLSIKLSAYALFPAPRDLRAPIPAPTLPAAFDPFSPPTAPIQPQAGAPQIAGHTRTGRPDDTLSLNMHQNSPYTGAAAGKDLTFTVFGQTSSSNGIADLCALQRWDSGTALVTLSDMLPDAGMYLLWAGNESGESYPIAINKTEAYWVGPNVAHPGNSVAVYGRHLSHNNGSTQAWVYIQSSTGAGQWITPTSINPYQVRFTLPSTLAPGEYQVWSHNGHGREFGWSAPVTLTVVDGPLWEAGTTIDVTTRGVVGDGVTDNTPAINSLIAQYRNLSGTGPIHTLYFPPGTYMISDTLFHAVNLRIHGAGMSQTIIKAKSNFAGSLMCNGHHSGVEFRDLTFDRGQSSLESMFSMQYSYELRLVNVRFEGQGATSMDVNGSRFVFLEGCEFVGHGIFLGASAQVFIDKCKFFATDDANNLIYSFGSSGVSVTNSTCQDYDNSNPNDGAGWGNGRFYTGTCLWAKDENIYIADNQTIEMTARPTFYNQNVGEQLLWEGSDATHSGNVLTATSTSAVFVTGNIYLDGQMAVIIDGKGLGQYRHVVSVDGPSKTINIEPQWDVIPDSTSIITLSRIPTNVVIFRNQLDAKPRAHESMDHIASVGIEFYEGGLDCVVDQNTITDTRAGLSIWESQRNGFLMPTYDVLVSNNEIRNTRYGIDLLGVRSDRGTSIINQIFRNNLIDDCLEMGIQVRNNEMGQWLNSNGRIIEHNHVENVPLGLWKRDDDGIDANTFFYKNTFIRGTAPFSGSNGITFIDFRAPLLGQNTFTGFQSLYTGSENPGAVLEIPYRVISLSDAQPTASLEVWNSGTEPLQWTAVSDATWLTLSPSGGTTADQNTVSEITATAHPLGLSPGNYQATVTVTAGTQIRKASVLYEVLASSSIAGKNFAMFGTATSSSSHDPATLGAGNAIDSDQNTRWAALYGQANNQWIEVDLGRPMQFNRIVTIEGASFITSYRIQIWSGGSWVDIASGTSIGQKKTDLFNHVTAQRVRLYIVSATKEPSIYSFEIYNDDLAWGATVTADSSHDPATLGPENAIDGNSSTRWAALVGKNTDNWLAIDFGHEVEFNKVVLLENGQTTSYALQVWEGSGWRSIATGTSLGSQTLLFETVRASKVRLYSFTASAGPSIYNFEVYNTPPLVKYGEDLAFKRYMSCSSRHSQLYEPEYSVDGDAGSAWVAAGVNNEWLEIDFNTRTYFNKLVLRERGSNIVAYRAQIEADGVWIDLFTDTTVGSEKIITFSRCATNKLRICIDGATSNPGFHSVEVYNEGGNMALNQTTTASSYHTSDYTPTSAIDGLASTSWIADVNTNPANSWIAIDFNKVVSFNQIVIKEDVNRISITSYRVQVDVNGTWTDVATGTTIGAAKTIAFTRQSASKVRLYINSASNIPSISEIEVYDL